MYGLKVLVMRGKCSENAICLEIVKLKSDLPYNLSLNLELLLLNDSYLSLSCCYEANDRGAKLPESLNSLSRHFSQFMGTWSALSRRHFMR